MTERRYDDTEAAAIFERAAEAPQPGATRVARSDGMTLAELQEIGREVGISAESIALAARMVDQGGPPASRTFLGMPLGVSRTVQLDRRLSDDEWERLVVDLRDTFDARGSARSQGSLRQWTNGNLQVLVEPTAAGDRVRLRTVKGDAAASLVAGLGMMSASAAGLVAAAVQGAVGDVGTLTAMGMLGAAGAAMLASSALRLPRWARTRRRQMDDVAARLSLAAPAPERP